MTMETFFNYMKKDFNTDNGQELALLDELRELMTERKNRNKDLYINIILLCFNYLQELNGIKDENGNFILNEILTPEIENKIKEIEVSKRTKEIINSEIF